MAIEELILRHVLHELGVEQATIHTSHLNMWLEGKEVRASSNRNRNIDSDGSSSSGSGGETRQVASRNERHMITTTKVNG